MSRPAKSPTIPQTATQASLRLRRDSAERLLNGVRAAVLVLLGIAALAYAPQLPRALSLTNLFIFVPMMLWTSAQYLLWYRQPSLPSWLAAANPVIDVTALTVLMAGYGFGESAVLALRSPIFIMYFVVLAARPVASSARKAAFVGALVVLEYAVLLGILIFKGALPMTASPVAAASSGRVSLLDEGAKLLMLIFAGIVAIYGASWAEGLVNESSREAEERNRVATRLVQAELDTLRLQLNPHFLFNALNGALALIASDPPAAEKMVSGLSEFLRMVLTTSSEREVTLDRELQLIERYVGIQQVRFGERLTVTIEAPAEARGALVPSLLLQPLVENAIRHGITPRADPGHVRVIASRRGEDLVLEVIDDGVGSLARRTRQRSRGMGLGLVNTTTRLIHAYGEAHRFTHGDRPEGGFAVEIVIPYRPSRSAAFSVGRDSIPAHSRS